MQLCLVKVVEHPLCSTLQTGLRWGMAQRSHNGNGFVYPTTLLLIDHLVVHLDGVGDNLGELAVDSFALKACKVQ